MKRLAHLLWLLPTLSVLVSGLAAAPAERVLVADNFEQTNPAASPYYWRPLLGTWGVAQRTTRVLRQTNEAVTSDSWIVALWANYAVMTKCLAEDGEGPWGIGVTGYENGRGAGYRLRLGEGHVYLEKVNGQEVRILADTEARVSHGKWYSLRLSLATGPTGTSLLGKIWGSDEEEPKDWQVKAQDTVDPLVGGSTSLWTGNCAGRFAFVAVRQYDPTTDKTGELLYSTDYTDCAQGRLPAFWSNTNGLWVRDVQDKLPLLRQMLDQPGPLYDENASLFLRWTGYTVSASVIAHPGNTKWGVGLIGYFGADGSSYRLRTIDNRAFLVKRRGDGRVEMLAAVPVAMQRGRWYRLKLSLDNLRDSVRLQGKVWDEETQEPAEWQMTAIDSNQPLRGGAPGLWCFGGAADFDSFEVKTSTLSALTDTLP